MVCLGFEPGATGWQAKTKPRCIGGTLVMLITSIEIVSCYLITQEKQMLRFHHSMLNCFLNCTKTHPYEVSLEAACMMHRTLLTVLSYLLLIANLFHLCPSPTGGIGTQYPYCSEFNQNSDLCRSYYINQHPTQYKVSNKHCQDIVTYNHGKQCFRRNNLIKI